jgi:hypothetical protein
MQAKRTRFTLDLDPTFRRRLKVMAAQKGVTMREYCLVAIESQLDIDEEDGTASLTIGEESVDHPKSFQNRRP